MTTNAADTLGAAIVGPVSRRGFIARAGAMPVAGLAAGGLATSAAAAVAGAKLSTFKGRYAVHGGRVIDGYFASPRGKGNLDVVVVVPATGTLDGAAEATARSYAADGYLAIAPNLPTSYKTAALLGKPAMVAALMRDVPGLKRIARGSGTVSVVAA